MDAQCGKPLFGEQKFDHYISLLFLFSFFLFFVFFFNQSDLRWKLTFPLVFVMARGGDEGRQSHRGSEHVQILDSEHRRGDGWGFWGFPRRITI